MIVKVIDHRDGDVSDVAGGDIHLEVAILNLADFGVGRRISRGEGVFAGIRGIAEGSWLHAGVAVAEAELDAGSAVVFDFEGIGYGIIDFIRAERAIHTSVSVAAGGLE